MRKSPRWLVLVAWVLAVSSGCGGHDGDTGGGRELRAFVTRMAGVCSFLPDRCRYEVEIAEPRRLRFEDQAGVLEVAMTNEEMALIHATVLADSFQAALSRRLSEGVQSCQDLTDYSITWIFKWADSTDTLLDIEGCLSEPTHPFGALSALLTELRNKYLQGCTNLNTGWVYDPYGPPRPEPPRALCAALLW